MTNNPGNDASGQNGRPTQNVFDLDDRMRVTHKRLGVWDFYQERRSGRADKLPGALMIKGAIAMLQNYTYVGRMIHDVMNIPGCGVLVLLYNACMICAGFLPALSLWYSGQLLGIIQSAISTHTVDSTLLIRIAIVRIGCLVLDHLLETAVSHLTPALQGRIKQAYMLRVFRVGARLDVPTAADPAVAQHFSSAWPDHHNVVWQTAEALSDLLCQAVSLACQAAVLVRVLWEQEDGALVAVLSFAPLLLELTGSSTASLFGSTWVATPANPEYVRAVGMQELIRNPAHRQELVAGGNAEDLIKEYEAASSSAGPRATGFIATYEDLRCRSTSYALRGLLKSPLKELPQLAFTLRMLQKPVDAPVTLASLQLIQQTLQICRNKLYMLIYHTGSIGERLASLRNVYDLEKIQNRIPDGTTPFPEDARSVKDGIHVEFRNVSFKYPGTTKYALRNVSFTIPQGGLCVLVGSNGSGKSTCLKLLARLYDPDEGAVLLAGHDVRTLRLADLRAALALLFQDFTHFPLSVRENIALGKGSADERHVEAARLAGAEAVVAGLPDGWDTYLKRPVQDRYSSLPEGTTTVFGRKVDFSQVRTFGGIGQTGDITLSGGQMQRLAVARTFMKTLPSTEVGEKVGLILFDEPSAALDPTAEHELFERLRGMRGSKTIIFSSHRFGNLTRYADVILYMNDGEVIETGTHENLMKQQGEYARIWNLQAQAFLA